MGHAKTLTPFFMFSDSRAQGVSLAARLATLICGCPNVRRAHGIISTRFDLSGAIKKLGQSLFGIRHTVPIFTIDRMGTPGFEALPRIWLSERVANTANDDGRRVFVEVYPTAKDPCGARALELGDRYLGEGSSACSKLGAAERIECFKAAEILYLHALKRGSDLAASRLRFIYDGDLCRGQYWTSYVEAHAKHARRHRGINDALGRDKL